MANVKHFYFRTLYPPIQDCTHKCKGPSDWDACPRENVAKFERNATMTAQYLRYVSAIYEFICENDVRCGRRKKLVVPWSSSQCHRYRE